MKKGKSNLTLGGEWSYSLSFNEGKVRGYNKALLPQVVVR